MSNSSKYLFPISGIKTAVWTFVIFVLIGVPFLFSPKENFTLWLNTNHSPFFDSFFYYATHLGDGLMFIPVFLLLLWRNYVLSIFFFVFVALEAFIVQVVLKKGIFAHLNRPPGYIENFDQLYHIPGVELNYMHTFPSGHTQSAFLMAFFLVLLFQNYKYLQVFIPVLAALVGLSRVYLLKHFFVDVWVGAIIGFGLPYIVVLVLQKRGKYPISKKGLLNLRKNP